MKTVTVILGFLCLSLLVAAQNPTCKAKNKKGDNCRSPFVMKTGYCRAHDTLTLRSIDASYMRCGDHGGRNSHGEPCRKTVKVKGARCSSHPETKKA